MDHKDISRELIEKAKDLPADELLELAKEEGIELSDEQLSQVAGGGLWAEDGCCPHCGLELTVIEDGVGECPQCGRQYTL